MILFQFLSLRSWWTQHTRICSRSWWTQDIRICSRSWWTQHTRICSRFWWTQHTRICSRSWWTQHQNMFTVMMNTTHQNMFFHIIISHDRRWRDITSWFSVLLPTIYKSHCPSRVWSEKQQNGIVFQTFRNIPNLVYDSELNSCLVFGVLRHLF